MSETEWIVHCNIQVIDSFASLVQGLFLAAADGVGVLHHQAGQDSADGLQNHGDERDPREPAGLRWSAN